jgi:hypothetical protein
MNRGAGGNNGRAVSKNEVISNLIFPQVLLM